MSGASGALAYLIVHTTRNRITRQLARARQPRYAIALLVGIGYFWLVFGRPGVAPAQPSIGFAGTAGILGGVGLAVTVMWWWLRGGVASALAFQPAEVHFLFTAPVSRPLLIAYKVARTQLLLVPNAALWCLLMRSWGVAIPVSLRFVTAWGFFSVLSLHRLGAALVQVQPAAGLRRAAHQAGRLIAAAAVATLVVGLLPVLRRFNELGFAESLTAAGAALHAAPATWAMAPFRLVVAPLTAASPGDWAVAFLPVLGVIALHLLWVLPMRVPFEEAAVAASADVARRLASFRAQREGGAATIAPGTRTRDWLPLAPTGFPPVAIVWKNTLALVRTGFLRSMFFMLVVMAVASRLLASDAEAKAHGLAMAPFLLVAFMTFLFGPRLMRNDLRQDLLNASLLKTYPLRGVSLVAAELASPTLVLTLMQFTALAAAYVVATPAAQARLGLMPVAPLAVLLVAGLVALNATSIGIHNATALLFPAWVRLGPESGGIEVMGQTMMLLFGSLLALALALVLPALAGGAALWLTRPTLGAAAAAPGAAVFVLVLWLEVIGLVAALGHVFDRMEAPTVGAG